MKLIRLMALALTILLSAQTLHAQITSANAMVEKMVAVLKDKDSKAFVALHPNKDQMMRLVGKMIKGIMTEIQKSPEAMKEIQAEGTGYVDSLITAQLMKKASPEEMAKMEQKHIEEFNSILKKGEEKGITWSNIVLTKADVDTVTVADEAMVKMFGSDKFRTMQGVLHFTSGTEGYQLSFNKVMFLPEEGGWYGVKLKQLAKEGEKLSDMSNKEEEEVTVENVEEVPPPPPPPARKKQKTKAKSTTTKTKTKTKS